MLRASVKLVQQSKLNMPNTLIPARANDYRAYLHSEVTRQWGVTDEHQSIVSVAAGTIHQESGWDPRAQSAYAKGLCQFTDPTWGDMVRLDDGLSVIGDVWNPSAAIRAMVSYHKRLWAAYPYEDRWPFVLSAYNGGAGNLNKDIDLTAKRGKYNTQVWWDNVELNSDRAPEFFKENRGYVSVILKEFVKLYSTF